MIHTLFLFPAAPLSWQLFHHHLGELLQFKNVEFSGFNVACIELFHSIDRNVSALNSDSIKLMMRIFKPRCTLKLFQKGGSTYTPENTLTML